VTARIVIVLVLLAGLIAGGAMYYLQVWGLYDRLPAIDTLTVATEAGPADLRVSEFRGIDSGSSPLRQRACFRLHEAEGLIEHPAPQPLNAPRWFDCFDAPAIDRDLAQGRATAYLVEPHFIFGFDRVMAVYADGRAFLWHQMNACGQAHFDGRPLPADCPPAPGT
jgi:hypothetical protein